MQINSPRRRKAISPVLATVILIAITLIAAIAIAGFVFGLFGSFTSSGQVSLLATNIPAPTTAAALTAPVCTAGGSPPAAPYLGFKNTGTASVSVTTLSLTYGGSTYTVAAPAGCSVAAGNIAWLALTTNHLGGTANTGQQFVGSASMSNGASVPITGTFL